MSHSSLKFQPLISEGLYPQSKRADPAVRKLALGILLQAFRDVVTPRRAPSREQLGWKNDALEWFFSDQIHPGSVLWVCHILEMDARELRGWLRDFQVTSRESRKKLARRLVLFRLPQ